MEKKQKVLIGVLVGIIIVLTAVCVYLLLNKENDTDTVNTNTPSDKDNGEKQEDLNTVNDLHYEIKEDNSGSYPRSLLYINGKLFNQID